MPIESFYQDETATDIIGREPAWIVKSGIGLVFIVTSFLIAITWFIQYPDSIAAPVTLQTTMATVEHRAKLEGHLDRIMAKEGEDISKGQPLALIESQINYDALLELENYIKSTQAPLGFHKLLKDITTLPSYGELDELQEYSSELVEGLKTWIRLSNNTQLKHKKRSTEQSIKQYKMLIQELIKKRLTITEQLVLVQLEFSQTEKMVKRNLLASNKLNEAKRTKLIQQSRLNDINIEIHEYEIKISSLHQELEAFELTQIEELTLAKIKVEQQQQFLLSKIRMWRQKHLLVSQIEGTLSFSQAWKLNQFVRKDDMLFNVIPTSRKMDAWMIVNGNGVGKIRPTQNVHIELENYPKAEYGILQSQVTSITKIPNEHGYLVKLELPKQLKLSQGLVLDDSPFLRGNGKIITKNRRLMTRFVDKIIYAFAQLSER